MFKKELYNKVVEVLNLNTSGVEFNGGYHIIFYGGIPHVIDQSLNEYQYERQEVVPVSEEFNTETASVNDSDRSDYIVQYQITFRLELLEQVETALEEFRTYFFNNKQHVIDGYNVSFKTTRGDKQGSWAMDGGNYYGRYKISVFCVAIKNGQLWGDNDIWEIKKEGDVTWERIIEIDDGAATNYNSLADNSNVRGKHYNTNGLFYNKFRIFYNGDQNPTSLHNVIYDAVMNKGDINQKFDLRETMNGIVRTYQVIITAGARKKAKNTPKILEFDVREV